MHVCVCVCVCVCVGMGATAQAGPDINLYKLLTSSNALHANNHDVIVQPQAHGVSARHLQDVRVYIDKRTIYKVCCSACLVCTSFFTTTLHLPGFFF